MCPDFTTPPQGRGLIPVKQSGFPDEWGDWGEENHTGGCFSSIVESLRSKTSRHCRWRVCGWLVASAVCLELYNMNPEDHRRLERQLENLEAELNQQKLQQSSFDTSQSIQSLYSQFIIWYQGLTRVGQVAVIVGGALIGLSLVSTVVKLISLALNLAVLGVIVYVAYKFFLAPQATNNNDS